MTQLISETDFEATFKPRNAPGSNASVGDLWSPHEIQSVDPRHVWTVVDGEDDDNLYALPGIHFVNRIGYVVTEEPWGPETTAAVWCDFDN